jgi:glucoamylase
VLGAVVAAGALLVSGGSGADPRTPRGLPGLPPPFLGTAVVGGGGLTAAIDAYGDVVDMRAPGPAGRALIGNPSDRQAAGTVPADTGIVPLVRAGGGRALPLWRADSVRQSYEQGTNVVATVAELQGRRVVVKEAARDGALAMTVRVRGPGAVPAASVNLEGGSCLPVRGEGELALTCTAANTPLPWGADHLMRAAARSDRRWLGAARHLGAGAPAWAARMYGRSLLALHALTDRRTGALAAGARDGWAYVWPRDASAAALAYAAAGYPEEAGRVVHFLLDLSLEQAARFHGDGTPVPGRVAQGDAIGWVAAAAKAAGVVGGTRRAARILSPTHPPPWRDRADYREGTPGDYLGNAIASAPADVSEFSRHIWGENSDTSPRRGLVREAADPDSGLDSAAAWAVRPFSRPGLYPAARATLNRLAVQGTPYGITPGEDWPGQDPWTAPTAWSAWSLAALSRWDTRRNATPAARQDRRLSLRLLGDLRRAATPAGTLPERVDARTGVPRSTTPLAWSHAFAILALRELWPDD